ncbi:ectoine/hydroxyectoine ABC transporter permease subunit EhuC [Actinacidiphila sp. bgisy160]|uniref:ectoine/hydroxyectoine ABC transporter permease subunit EhuC n=1 Tax=Actinacidiphila sp. bgisy160 TaxID=3413796 RepID=UPI003D72938E
MEDFFTEFFRSWPGVLESLAVTVEVTVLGALLALVLSFLLGFAAGAPWRPVRGACRTVVEFFRGTSLFVQLFWLFYALPIIGYQLVPLACAVVALGLNFGAYGSEVVRGALAAVPREQREAAIALNMTAGQRMRLVVLPQAWPQMIPPFNNLLIQVLKSTPLVSLITVADITFRIQQLRSATGETKNAYLVLLVLYFVLAYVLTLAMNALERAGKARLGQGSARTTRLRGTGTPLNAAAPKGTV